MALPDDDHYYDPDWSPQKEARKPTTKSDIHAIQSDIFDLRKLLDDERTENQIFRENTTRELAEITGFARSLVAIIWFFTIAAAVSALIKFVF